MTGALPGVKEALAAGGREDSVVGAAVGFGLAAVVFGIVVGGLHSARRKASESEERFRALAEGAYEGVVLSQDGKITDVNLSLTRMLGYEAEELIGKSAAAFVLPEDRATVARKLAEGNTEPYEIRTVKKDGTTFLAEVRPRQEIRRGRRFRVTSILDLTERKEFERRVREAEERFRLLVERIPAVTYVQEPSGEKPTVYVSPQARSILGYSPEKEVLDPGHWEDRLHPDDRERVLAEDERTDLTGEPFRAEYRTYAYDGRLVWVRDEAVLVRGPGGEPLYWLGVQFDVTGQKRTEEALRQSEDLYRTVVEQAAENIFIVDGETRRVVEANAAFRASLGYGEEEVRDLRLDDLVVLEQGELEGSVRRISGGERFVGERKYRRKDGTLLDMEVSASAISYGEREALCIVAHDVTERRRYEEELRRSEASLLEAQRVARVGDWEYDLAGDKARWSDEMFRIFGFEPGEFEPTYRMFFDSIHPSDRNPVRREVFRALKGSPDAEGDAGDDAGGEAEYRILRGDGEVRSVHTRYKVERAAGRAARMFGTVQDVTESKRYEAEIESRAEELRRSNAELEQFAYVASHDLQEPLRMVSSYTQLLKRRYEGRLDADADEFIGYAVDGAERMRRLINDLLAYSRVGTRGRPLVPTSTQKVLEGALANLQVAIEESRAEVEVAGPLPTVLGDETQLAQLFQNLLGNAIKFRGEWPVRVRVRAERRPGEWAFVVEDNGIGIEAGQAERIFVIFQRLHDRAQYGGTGIGLAICKKIVERHGGTIRAESEGVPGRGSRFVFTLKAVGAPAATTNREDR